MTQAAVPPTTMQKLAAEAIGTFVLVLFGVGAAVAAAYGPGDYASIGLAFGIAVVAMVYAFGRVSGGHFNPAVSVGAALGGRISWKDAGTYSAAQVVGGLVGGVVLMLVMLTGDTGWEFGDALGANGAGDEGIAVPAALIIELVMTFVFVLVILAVTDTRNEHPGLAPLAIGLTLAAIHFASVWATGTSVNPARSISVAFFSGSDYIIDLWIFILAPLLGAAVAGLAYPALFGHGADPVPGSGLSFSSGRAAAPMYGVDQYQQQWNQQAPAAGGYPAPGGYAAPEAQQAPQQGYPDQGYQDQGYQQQGQYAGAAEQPIIQDGWQWDPQAQQWIPAQQQPEHPQQGQYGQQGQVGWPGSGESTQVRPPE